DVVDRLLLVEGNEELPLGDLLEADAIRIVVRRELVVREAQMEVRKTLVRRLLDGVRPENDVVAPGLVAHGGGHRKDREDDRPCPGKRDEGHARLAGTHARPHGLEKEAAGPAAPE